MKRINHATSSGTSISSFFRNTGHRSEPTPSGSAATSMPVTPARLQSSVNTASIASRDNRRSLACRNVVGNESRVISLLIR
ncbi:hypothetical protein LSAT2_025876 [Lamellibrachia satsuma]|nr:hypothetical protein LSAT2_025876 [Lamellibrachia satsuma]